MMKGEATPQMTIAACYLSPEGFILGADSTSTFMVGGQTPHYFDFNQKVFEVGENSTLGIMTWGRGGLADVSHRTLIARLADELNTTPVASVGDAASRWNDLFSVKWEAEFKTQIQIGQALEAKGAQRTAAEEQELARLVGETYFGFCLGGYSPLDRTPQACAIEFDPRRGKRSPQPLATGASYFWGVPNPILRMIRGVDEGIIADIMGSKKWTGTEAELRALAYGRAFGHPGLLPLRDAIDFVHSIIYTTIKALKFSQFVQICGGPIEIAVISSDRRFRWVRHKAMDDAITLQEPRHARRS